jgi:hypothetical protein
MPMTISEFRSMNDRVLRHLQGKHGALEGNRRLKEMTLRDLLETDRKISCLFARTLTVPPR